MASYIFRLLSNIPATDLLPNDACRGVPFSAMRAKKLTKDAREGTGGCLVFTRGHALLARYQPSRPKMSLPANLLDAFVTQHGSKLVDATEQRCKSAKQRPIQQRKLNITLP